MQPESGEDDGSERNGGTRAWNKRRGCVAMTTVLVSGT